MEILVFEQLERVKCFKDATLFLTYEWTISCRVHFIFHLMYKFLDMDLSIILVPHMALFMF